MFFETIFFVSCLHNFKLYIMKKLILSFAALCCTSMMSSQITLLDENFDSFTDFAITGFGNWQTLDLDGLTMYSGGGPVTDPVSPNPPQWPNIDVPQAFIIFNPSAAGVTNNATSTPADSEIRNFTPHSGAKFAGSWGGVPAAPVTANNDWLISPPIQMGGSGNSLSFWVKALSPDYGPEKFKVGVYVGSGTPTSAADFTIISGPLAINATYAAWVQKTYALAYPNQTIRIAIQNVSADVYMLMVDDVKITAGTLGTSEAGVQKNYSLYPNPTKGEFSIKSEDKIVGIRVYDATGKLVMENRNTNKGDISQSPTGTYYLNIAFADGSIKTEKLLKK